MTTTLPSKAEGRSQATSFRHGRTTRDDIERELCRRLFPDFLARVRIQEPPAPGVPGSGGVIPFQPWPHLMEFAQDLLRYRLIAKLKARQLGFTWEVAAYLDWLCNYYPGSDWLWLSKSEPDAAERRVSAAG